MPNPSTIAVTITKERFLLICNLNLAACVVTGGACPEGGRGPPSRRRSPATTLTIHHWGFGSAAFVSSAFLASPCFSYTEYCPPGRFNFTVTTTSACSIL